MSNTRIRPILFASVTLIALAMIWAGASKAAVKSEENDAAATNAPTIGGAANGIPSEQAKQHVGETNTVCGLVASTRYMDTAKTKPTLLNFDRPFPDHTFSVMIPDASRGKFTGPPEMMFKGKTVCVTGAIIEFRGKPEIIVTDSTQIVVSDAAPATPDKAATNTVEKTPAPATKP